MPFSVRRRERGGRNVLKVSSSAGEMDALRARISSQSRAVAAHIAADAEAQASLDDWATPEPPVALTIGREQGGSPHSMQPQTHGSARQSCNSSGSWLSSPLGA